MSSDFLATADALAREIADTAVWFGGRCSWMGALPGDESRPLGSERVHAALGPDLYDGTGGAALFLAEAAARLDDDRLRATALGAIRHSLDHASGLGDGLYGGRVGIAYAAARVAAATGSESAREGARQVLREWRLAGAEPRALDVFGGAAGAAIGLLALADMLDEPWRAATATELGNVLVARAGRSAGGWSWPDPSDGAGHHLCGYSHGAAGIGHALLELSAASGEDRFADAGARAFAYERSWFDRRGGSWPDLRGVARAAGWDPPAPAAGSWCHGAPGIALSRLRSRSPDAGSALEATRQIASGLLGRAPDDFSLCHGAAGVGDVLLYAGDTGLAGEIGHLGMETDGFACGVPEGRTPGLFRGLAGIGLFYLRLADPGLATPLIVHAGARVDTREPGSLESAGRPGSEVSHARPRGPRA